MKKIAIALAVMMLGLGPAFAADGLSLSTGFDYSTGKYGGTASTEVIYVPLVIKYESGPALFKLTVPQIEISRPATPVNTGSTVVVNEEDLVIYTPAGSATQATKVSGQGDIVAAATYNAFYDRESGLLLDLGGKIKFATADETRGLGTGKNDYAVQFDAYKTFGNTTLLASLGYKWMGKPVGSNFRNIPFASAGLIYKSSDRTTLGAIFDWRPSVVTGGNSQQEISAYVAHHLDKNWKVQGYIDTGLTKASADAGVGGTIGYAF